MRDLCKSIGGSKVANALSKADAEEQFVDTLVREVYGTKEEVDPTNLLFQAVEWKDAARAEALVCFGADPNARRHGRSVVYIAACSDSVEVLRCLHNLGVDLGAPCTEQGDTAARIACNRRPLVMRLLRDLGVSMSAPCTLEGKTPAYFVSIDGTDPDLLWILKVQEGARRGGR